MPTAVLPPIPPAASDNSTPLDTSDPLHRQLEEINKMRVYPLTLEELRQFNAALDELEAMY